MRSVEAVLVCGIAALAVTGCSGGCRTRATATPLAAAESVPAAGPAFEDRLLAVLRGVEVAAGEDFASGARRFEAARKEMFLLQSEPLDPEQRKSVDAIAVRNERARREFLRQRVPTEVRGWMHSTAAAAARADTLEEARRRYPRRVEVDAFERLSRVFLPEAHSAELDRLLAFDAAELSEEDADRLRRLATVGKSVKVELAGAWMERSKEESSVTSYGSGTVVVTGPPSGAGEESPTPEQWWRDATFDERTDWLITWTAERSSLVQVLRVWDEVCASCRPGGDGDPAEPRCRDCGGGGCIRKVRWR